MSAEENKKAGAKAAAPKKKRGRPSKAELAARAKEEGAETATNAASPTGTTGVSPVAVAINCDPPVVMFPMREGRNLLRPHWLPGASLAGGRNKLRPSRGKAPPAARSASHTTR